MKELKPTESELEILQVLWSKGPCTVREVHEHIYEETPTRYTTTLKTMQVMVEKGFVTRNTAAMTHIYRPKLSKEKYFKGAVTKMIKGLFEGSKIDFLVQALGNETPTQQELEQLKRLLDQYKSKKNE